MFKCIVCYKEAEVIFEGQTMCKVHFESLWTYQTSGKTIGHEAEWGKSLLEMKREYGTKKR